MTNYSFAQWVSRFILFLFVFAPLVKFACYENTFETYSRSRRSGRSFTSLQSSASLQDEKRLISIFSPELHTFMQRFIYCDYKYLHENLRRTSLRHTHRGSRQSSLSGEASQSWGPVFTRASLGSRVSLGALLPRGTRQPLLSRWTWGSGVATLAHGSRLSWWTLGGRRNCVKKDGVIYCFRKMRNRVE